MKTRTVTKRDEFNAQHSELDFGNDLIITTNNKIRQARSLTLPQKRTLVAAAPAFVAREGSSNAEKFYADYIRVHFGWKL